VTPQSPPSQTRRARLWRAAEVRKVPLQAILVSVAVVVIAYLSDKIIDRLRGVILLLVVAGFIALLLNPLVVALQQGSSGVASQWHW
jgi:predicted PurR-regulated permease PerM